MSTSNYEDPRPQIAIVRFFKNEVCLFLKFKDMARTRGVFSMTLEDFLKIPQNFLKKLQNTSNFVVSVPGRTFIRHFDFMLTIKELEELGMIMKAIF